MSSTQDREAHFHDELRSKFQQPGSPEFKKYTAYRKWYSITRSSRRLAELWARQLCDGKLVLDCGSGRGRDSVMLAKSGAMVTGIDVSGVSVEMGKELAQSEGVADRTVFLVADAEALDFPDDSFDLIWVSGVLHHLDVDKAYREFARVLKPGGHVICQEALGLNPLINLYRKRTPYVRSEDEHPLLKSEVDLAHKFFGTVERRFFHLAALGGVPFRKFPGFTFLLATLEVVDNVLLRLPWFKWQAWIVVFLMSQPRKEILKEEGIEGRA